MGLLEWGPEHRLGVEVLDEEHKQIFKLVNDLQVAMMFGTGKSALKDVLNGLVEYAKRHFATEEKYMQDIGYAGYAAHKAEHDQFLARIGEFQKEFEAGTVGISVNLLSYLRDWLENHLEKEDRRLVAASAKRHAQGGIRQAR